MADLLLIRDTTRADKLILMVVFICVIALYARYWSSGFYGKQAVIFVNGEHWSNVDLSEEQLLEIKGKLGQTQLQVSERGIRFVESPCSSQYCIHQGWIQHAGEFAACLPNQVSVRINGPDPRFDTINF